MASYRKEKYKGKIRYKLRYDVKLNGKRVQRETKWHDNKDDCYSEYLDILNNNEPVKAVPVITVGELFNQFYKEAEVRAHRKTIDKKSSDYSLFTSLQSLKNKYPFDNLFNSNISDVVPLDFANYLDYLNKTDLMTNTILRFKSTLYAFIEWLYKNKYIDEYFKLSVPQAFKTVKIKNKKVYKRHDRYFPKYKDIYTIQNFYYSSGLQLFKNYYFFTAWTVLYYSALRVGEFVALLWKDISFNENGVIMVRDAIGEEETIEDVETRHKAGIRLPKNDKSIRNVSMYQCYRDIFHFYKYLYSKYYGVSKDEMDEMYVFPNINSLVNDTSYMPHKNLLRNLQSVCRKTKLPSYDSQMFRHGSAYFLCYNRHIPIQDCFKIFGHTDSEMVRDVYLEMKLEENRTYVDVNLKNLITSDEVDRSKLDYVSLTDAGEYQFIESEYLAEKIYRYYMAIQSDKEVKEFYYMKGHKDIVEKLNKEFKFVNLIEEDI